MNKYFKLATAVFFAALVISLIAICSVSAANIALVINGEKIYTDQPPIEVQDRILVPIRAVSENLNCKVIWDEATQTAQIENAVSKIAVQIGSGYITKVNPADMNNPIYIPIDVPAMKINDSRTMVPVRAVSEALHAKVEWSDFERTVKITMEYDGIGDYYEGLAAVCKDGKWGFIDENRNVVIPLVYTNTFGYFNDGLAAVNNKSGAWGFINTSGKTVIPFRYDSVQGKFTNGMVAVKMTGKCGFIDRNGNIVVSIKYDEIRGDSFVEGRMAVKLGTKWGFVDENDKLVIPAAYDEVSDFENGKASVFREGQRYYIDLNGKTVD